MATETDLLQIDDQLGDEERLIRDTVRAFVTDHILPEIADWFEAGILPRPDLEVRQRGAERGVAAADGRR
jgi:alkylation response protein AidB-like acyl-CoA dehydrogenase